MLASTLFDWVFYHSACDLSSPFFVKATITCKNVETLGRKQLLFSVTFLSCKWQAIKEQTYQRTYQEQKTSISFIWADILVGHPPFTNKRLLLEFEVHILFGAFRDKKSPFVAAFLRWSGIF